MKIKSVLFGKVLALLIFASPCIAEVVHEIDSNFDGKTDQWQHVDTQGNYFKIEYDGDFDGKVDQIEHFEGDKVLWYVEYDRNKDGKMDHMQYYANGGKLVRVEKSSKYDGTFDWKEFYNSNEKLTHIEIDDNRDGKADTTQFYNSSDQLIRVEQDSDKNGKVDRWSYFRGGSILDHTNFDSSGDGKVDQWQFYYEDETLKKADYDTNGDGKADRWEHFNSSGKLEKTEVDRNFDGKIDWAKNNWLNILEERLAKEANKAKDNLADKQLRKAKKRLAEEARLLEEERKKHQTLKNFKEAERLARERKLLKEERKKLEALFKEKEIQERKKRETLRVDEEKRKQQPRVQTAYSGTGFLFSSKDYIITNWHVVRGSNNIQVKFINGEKIKAEVAVKDTQNDIAFLKLERQPQLPPSDLKIGDSSRINISDEVFTIGYPAHWLLGENPKYTKGEVNALSGMRDDPRVFQISVQIQPGNSGGPLFNSKGEVIGITQASLDPKVAAGAFGTLPQNVNYAIKSSYISSLLPMLPETLIASRGIVVVPTEPENTLANFIEKAKKNIVLIEAKE